MDELLTLGCIALFFALVVVPILAIIALSRSTAVRSELATLRRRVEVLEQRGVTEAPATVVTTVPQSVSQMVVPVETSSPAVNIVLSEPVADVTSSLLTAAPAVLSSTLHNTAFIHFIFLLPLWAVTVKNTRRLAPELPRR
jgi:hypothetical protein